MKAGGTIMGTGHPRVGLKGGDSRNTASLSPSRSFGDFWLKSNSQLGPTEQIVTGKLF